MATGTQTYMGMAVPLFGESTIEHQTAGTDCLTIRSQADGTAANMFAARLTASSAVTAGYTQGFYVNMNLSGGMTGGSTIQANCFAADITLSGTNTAWITGCYIYICEGTAAEISAGIIDGYCAWFAATGDVALIRAGFHAGSEEVYGAVGTIDGALVVESGSTGAWRSMLVAYGGPPTYFLDLHGCTGTGTYSMLSSEAEANVAAATHWLRVDREGTIMWIALHASCSD